MVILRQGVATNQVIGFHHNSSELDSTILGIMSRIVVANASRGDFVNCILVSASPESEGGVTKYASVIRSSGMSFGLTVSITMVWYDWGDTKVFHH